jgi:hypothetical protein
MSRATRSPAWVGCKAAEHLSNLIPVLESSDGKKPQKGRHGWKASAHVFLLV